MSSSEERKRKKDAIKAWKQRELAVETAKMPIGKDDLQALFEWLDRPDVSACDHTLNDTIKFLDDRGLDKGKIIPWLNEYGGYCDCEILANVEDKWGKR